MSSNADVDRQSLTKLNGQLKSGATGTLSVGKGALQLTVFVRKGALVGATCADDAERLLRRLTVDGTLPEQKASELAALSELDEPILGPLLAAVSDDTLATAMRDRFEDNLVRFIGTTGKPRFKKASTIWPRNVQVVAAPNPLLDRMLRFCEDAERLPLDATLSAGPRKPSGDRAAAAVAAVGDGATVLDVVAQLPLEGTEARILLGDLVVDGVLKSTAFTATEGTSTIDDFGAEPATEEVPGEDGPMEESLGIGSLHDWMGQAELVDDDELDAFADNESNRSAGSEAAFPTAERSLETVEVVPVSAPEPEAAADVEPIPADEASSTGFSAPPMSEEDAGAKVEVANESLRAICRAVDKVNGNGAGRANIRILVEGVPSKFQALFAKIAPAEDGSLPIDDMLDNLYTRPASEHRALLSQGLTGLIDRGIEAVADDLPDEDFDEMYEACAGYRQKLGL